MELNYDYDLWQVKNMIEGREEVDLNWIGKLFESYFKKYWDTGTLFEEEPLQNIMAEVEERLENRLKIANKLREYFNVWGELDSPTRFDAIGLASCTAVVDTDEYYSTEDIPPELLGTDSDWEDEFKSLVQSKVKALQIKNKKKEDEERAEYERLKAKYGSGE